MMNCLTSEAEPGRTASWISMFPVDGYFVLESWWTSGSDRSPSVCYRVVHEGGISDIFIDQSAGGGEWVTLGYFSFNGECSVQIIGSESSPGVIVADAVKLTPPLDITEHDLPGLTVVSNPASSFTILLPSTALTEVVVYNAAGRRVSTLVGAGSVEWTPIDLPAGIYFAMETSECQSVKLVYLK